MNYCSELPTSLTKSFLGLRALVSCAHSSSGWHLLIWELSGWPESNIHAFSLTLVLAPDVSVAEMFLATLWSLETCFTEKQSQGLPLAVLSTVSIRWTQACKHQLTLPLLTLQSLIPCSKGHEEIVQAKYKLETSSTEITQNVWPWGFGHQTHRKVP